MLREECRQILVQKRFINAMGQICHAWFMAEISAREKNLRRNSTESVEGEAILSGVEYRSIY